MYDTNDTHKVRRSRDVGVDTTTSFKGRHNAISIALSGARNRTMVNARQQMLSRSKRVNASKKARKDTDLESSPWFREGIGMAWWKDRRGVTVPR